MLIYQRSYIQRSDDRTAKKAAETAPTMIAEMALVRTVWMQDKNGFLASDGYRTSDFCSTRILVWLVTRASKHCS